MTTEKYILGLNHGEVNSSAALIRGGRVVAGSPEERFNRQKLSRAFPRKAIDYCVGREGIAVGDCTAIAQAWNPGAGWQKFNPLISAQRSRREDYFYSVPDNLLDMTGRRDSDWVRMDFSGNGLPPIYYVQHHRAHAGNAFFLSPFEEAAILTCDWRGEFECTTWSHGRGNSIELLQSQSIPNSLGMYYGTFTEFLGYRPDSDEWKVMALSAFDVDSRKFEEAIRGTMRLNDDGTFELDQSFYKGALLDQPKLYTQKFIELFGGREGQPGEEATEWHCAVARAMQVVAEEIAVHFLNHLHARTKCRAVTLSGGFFMNSVFNGKLIDKTPFRDMYVSYAPADVGNSIGAGLYVSHCVYGAKRDFGYNSSGIGPEFGEAEIVEALRRRRIAHRRVDNPQEVIAEYLNDGRVVALFQGPMEFGERALGHRSILGDPRRPDIKDRINASIKYREAYRPFAPSVLYEKAPQYFDVPEGFECAYMEKVVPVRNEYRAQLPGITHVDGSGRVQTVKAEHDPFYYGVIEAFGKKTGIPIVLNTSFNINGEPIVLSPDDALTTFFNSGLDCLALGPFIVEKNLAA
jgi:carbamoyltransferase